MQEAFLPDDWDPSSTPPCARAAGNVHALAAGFANFRLNAYIGLDESRGQVTLVVLETGAGPNLVREDFLPKGWEQHRRPLRVRFVIIDANGRQNPPTSAIALVIRMGMTQMRATFFVVKHLAVPVVLGCAFAPRTSERFCSWTKNWSWHPTRPSRSHGEHRPKVATTDATRSIRPPATATPFGHEEYMP